MQANKSRTNFKLRALPNRIKSATFVPSINMNRRGAPDFSFLEPTPLPTPTPLPLPNLWNDSYVWNDNVVWLESTI